MDGHLKRKRKGSVIRFRVTAGMKKGIEMAARHEGITASHWIRRRLAKDVWDQVWDQIAEADRLEAERLEAERVKNEN